MWIVFAVNMVIHLEDCNIKIINVKMRFVVNVQSGTRGQPLLCLRAN